MLSCASSRNSRVYLFINLYGLVMLHGHYMVRIVRSTRRIAECNSWMRICCSAFYCEPVCRKRHRIFGMFYGVSFEWIRWTIFKKCALVDIWCYIWHHKEKNNTVLVFVMNSTMGATHYVHIMVVSKPMCTRICKIIQIQSRLGSNNNKCTFLHSHGQINGAFWIGLCVYCWTQRRLLEGSDYS